MALQGPPVIWSHAYDLPKHPEYQIESERLSTFRTWGVQSPEALCRAGFYYTGDQSKEFKRVAIFLPTSTKLWPR